MASGRFEDSETLLRHSEIVLANLEAIAINLTEGGEFMTSLQTPDGIKLQKFAAEYIQAKREKKQLPTLHGSLEGFREQQAMKLIQVIKAIDYTVKWGIITQFQLQRLTQSTRELDIRWNYPVTMSIVKLFIAYSKVCLYLNRIECAVFAVQLFQSSTLASTISIDCRYDELLDFVNGCQDPLLFISRTMDFLKHKMSILVVNLFPFFSLLFADWTFFDWSMLSIYDRAPEDCVGTSLPIDELTYLANVPIIQEMMALFLVTWPEYIDKNQQFAQLATAVLSETKTFYLSRTVDISIDALIGKTLKATIDAQYLRKNLQTHLFRMKQIVLLAEDLSCLSDLDPNQFLRSYYQMRAVCAFGYYELDMFFRAREIKQQVPADVYSNYVKTVGSLMMVLVKLGEFFVSNSDIVQRFFTYNLGVADSQYLGQLLEKFQLPLGDAGGDIVEATRAIKRSLDTIDLDEFDNGVRYDFLPAILTHGRALYKYNMIAMNLRISYLNPLFEHLMTIDIHAAPAQDPVRAFLEACPLHTLWRHTQMFIAIVSNNLLPLNTGLSFLTVFQFFSYDNIVLPVHQGKMKVIRADLGNVRAKLSSRMNSLITSLLKNDSKIAQYSSKFNTIQKEDISKSFLNKNYIIEEAKSISTVYEATEFLRRLPGSFVFFNESIAVRGFFSRWVATDLIRISLFGNVTNLSVVSEIIQVVWPFFMHSGLSLKESLFTGILNNTIYQGESFVSQADTLSGKTDLSPYATQTLIKNISTIMIQFADGNHSSSLYSNYIQSFIGSSPCISLQFFVSTLRVVGVSGALFLDGAMITYIIQQISQLCKSFVNQTTKPKDFSDDFDRLIKVSVALTIRSLIRSAVAQVIDEAIPGLEDIIQSNSLEDGPIKHLLDELSGEKKYNYNIIESYKNKVGTKFPNSPTDFFIYLARVVGSFHNRKIVYHPNEDALSGNTHLIPFAFELFTDLIPVMFQSSSYQDIDAATRSFFAESAKINPQNPLFLILIDKFHKLIPTLEYGRIDKAFPYTLLASGYQTLK